MGESTQSLSDAAQTPGAQLLKGFKVYLLYNTAYSILLKLLFY